MQILIEEHQYKAEKIKNVLEGIDALENVEGFVSLNYVGYFYNSRLRDCVFILPKVLLEDVDGQELVFGKYHPEDIINTDAQTPLSQQEKDFIYEFSVWIYRAICVFRDDRQNNTSIVLHKQIIQTGKGRRKLANTFLDILLALIQWNKDNQNFIFFTLRNIHSGFNKINWTRTIAKNNAILQDDTPNYLNAVNKKKKINFDEELLIIFFSILNYIADHYGFAKNLTPGYSLIKGSKFNTYLKGYGKTRLLQIKYKYFSDKALELWELCYAFFDSARQVHTSAQQKEYLLVKNFNIVFEAIIDELIADKNIPAGLKEQDDGKLVDHMYTYQGLTTHDQQKPIYYIGDSKYYKRGHNIGKESVYKQFTYARNVIQWNLNLFMNNEANPDTLEKSNGVPMLRDEKTEGYNIIPNFFISARLNKELSYNEEISLSDNHHPFFSNRQFKNRLFDRDTLLVCHYDVNFLFVIALYARNNKLQKKAWQSKVRAIFRTEIQNILKENFDFYAMQAHPDVVAESYIKEHFQTVLGKVYSPYNDSSVMSLALDNDPEFLQENIALLSDLRQSFFVEKIELGSDPTTALASVSQQAVAPAPQQKDGVLMVMMEQYDAKSKNFLSTSEIAIAIKITDETSHILENISSIGYILFHTRNDKNQHLFAIVSPCTIKTDNSLDKAIYRNMKEKEFYLIVNFNNQELDSSALHSANAPYTPTSRYDAQFITLSALK